MLERHLKHDSVFHLRFRLFQSLGWLLVIIGCAVMLRSYATVAGAITALGGLLLVLAAICAGYLERINAAVWLEEVRRLTADRE